jgi:chorismate mutase/prephenate dehydrogenase
MTENATDLEELRAALSAVDRRLLELVAERQRIVEDIGRHKQQAGRATRDFNRERVVIEDALAEARRLGLPDRLVETLIRLLIRSSLTTQEQARVAAEGSGSGRRALVIGGAGRIGRWFCGFLESQGYAVSVADPAAEDVPWTRHGDWRGLALDEDVIVVATPLEASGRILGELAERRPPGLIFDVGSLKSPLRAGLEALAAAGCRVTSLHPMFGPDTRLLSGRHVIFVDAGCPAATAEARRLFEPTMAELVDMDLDSHDRLIAYVLGLSHATNIAFFTALAESGEDVPHLASLSSTTFDAQLEVAGRVAAENPALYFEIQSLNEHGPAVLAALEEAVGRIRAAVCDKDAASFVRMMEQGAAYFARRRRRDAA